MRVSDTARRPAPQPIQDEGMTQVVRVRMNRALRRLSPGLPGDVRPAAGQRQLRAGLPHDQPGRRAGQRPGLQPAVQVPARLDHHGRARRSSRRPGWSRGTAGTTSGTTRTAQVYAPVTGLRPTLFGATGIEEAENKHAVRHRPEAHGAQPDQPGHREARQGAHGLHSRSSSAAQEAAYAALKAEGRESRGGRARPEDRRDPGHGLVPDVRPEQVRHARPARSWRGSTRPSSWRPATRC